MAWQVDEKHARKFYQVSRHAELVFVKDRDVMAFYPDIVQVKPTKGMKLFLERQNLSTGLQQQSRVLIKQSSVK
jgi:hypothetical protein